MWHIFLMKLTQFCKLQFFEWFLHVGWWCKYTRVGIILSDCFSLERRHFIIFFLRLMSITLVQIFPDFYFFFDFSNCFPKRYTQTIWVDDVYETKWFQEKSFTDAGYKWPTCFLALERCWKFRGTLAIVH